MASAYAPAPAGRAELSFTDGTVVVLGPSSEVTIEELLHLFYKEVVALTLTRGTLLVDARSSLKSDFSLSLPFSTIDFVGGSIYAKVTEGSTRLSALSGQTQVHILDEGSTLETTRVQSGSTLELTERKVNLLRVGGNVQLTQKTDPSVFEEPVLLALREELAVPATEEEPAEEIEEPTPQVEAATETLEPANDLPRISFSQPNTAAPITTEPIEIVGALPFPEDTAFVEVQAGTGPRYRLSGYTAGDETFLYRAQQSFGNVTSGNNVYNAFAFAEDDTLIATGRLAFVFVPGLSAETDEENPAAAEEAASTAQQPAEESVSTTEKSVPSAEEAAQLPVIIQPEADATYTTEPIAFSGTVPAAVQAIEINGYRLTSFTAGDTAWRYNAATEYGNLAIGENTYEVVAFFENGTTSSARISIVFSPESTPES